MACSRTRLVHRDAERTFTERGNSLLTNATNSRKWWSILKTMVFGASSSLPPLLDSGGQQKRRLLCFWCTLMLSSTEIAFSSRKLVSLDRYCVLLPSVLALFAVCFWIRILMEKIIPMICFHFFISS